MTSNIWQTELIRCCDAIDGETTKSLNNIQAYCAQSGLSMNLEFKINFLKALNYRLMESYKRFELALSMNKCLIGTAIESADQKEDIHMPEASSGSFEGHMLSSNVLSTPFMVANTPTTRIDDMLNDMLPPQTQPQKEIIPCREVEARMDTKREWICYACKEEGQRHASKFIFSAIENLHDHWQSKHAANNEPFRFYAADLLSCSIKKCRYFSTFYGLQKHHSKEHPSEIFVAIQNRRCALCLYDGNNLKAHKCNQLEKVKQLKLFNPVRYTEQAVAELQELHNKFECKHCNSVFDTSHEVMSHHHEQHGHLKIESGKSEVKRIVTLICGCCKLPIAPGMHVQHLRTISQKRWSHTNTWESWFQRFENDYLRTKVVFGNGLVVFKQNLIATGLGGPGYNILARELFNTLQRN